MNKKKVAPTFKYPFKDVAEEKDRQMLDNVRTEYISDKGSKVKLTETYYSGGYRKLVLTETVYLKNSDKREKLSDVLELKPQNQIHREQYLVFNVSIEKDGKIVMTKKDSPKETAEFNSNEAKVILYFYELSNVILAKAPIDLDFIYKNKETVRMAIVKINRKFAYGFQSLNNKKERKLISGTSRKNYSFNPYIKLNVLK